MRSKKPDPPSILTSSGPLDIIPMYGGGYDDIVTAVLERAQEKAKLYEPGRTFEVSLTDEELERCKNPKLVSYPALQRAKEFELMPEGSHEEKIYFSHPYNPTPPADVEP